jgi:outer membrane protein
MKKMTKILPLSILMATSAASADTVFGIYAGAGQWQADYEGTIGNPAIELQSLGLKDSDNNYYFVALEHGVPVIPNIRLQRTDISSRQSAIISQTFTLDEVTFTVNSEVTSDVDLTHTDGVLYYEVLDNWVNLDLGLTLRKFDGYATAMSPTARETVTLDKLIPMIYGHARFNLPFTGFAVGGALNAISYNDNKITDYNAYVSYTFDSAMDIGAEVGYRSLDLRSDDKNARVDATLAGPYASILLHF